MPYDDDSDDFSHLPTVDSVHDGEARKIWKKHREDRPRLEVPAAPNPASESEHITETPAAAPDGLTAPEDPVAAEQSHAPTPPVVEEYFVEDHSGPRWDHVSESETRLVPASRTHQDKPASRAKPVPTPGRSIKIAPLLKPSPPEPPPSTPETPGGREKIIPSETALDEKETLVENTSSGESSDTTGTPAPENTEEQKATPPAVPRPETTPGEPDPDSPEGKKKRRHAFMEKIGARSLAWSLSIHGALLLLATVFVFTTQLKPEVDFLPGGQTKGAADATQEVQHKVRQKKNTWLKNSPVKTRIVSLSEFADVKLPEADLSAMDFPDKSGLMDLKGMGGLSGRGGSGSGFGMGAGLGSKITFLGNTAMGRHVVFVVDVSASMSAIGKGPSIGEPMSRFALLKHELIKSVSRLPLSTRYQVIFFSDFAWPHNEIRSQDLKKFESYKWEITSKNINVRVPSYRYIEATTMSLMGSVRIIEEADNPGGTNWGSGLIMALKGSPKPDVIFFMTDGNSGDEQGWVDAVTLLNKRSGKPTVINTTAMMEPDAAEALARMAALNKGAFTIVLDNGQIVKGDDFFARRSR